MPSTQEVSRRSQCEYRHRDTLCPYPHGDMETLHTNQTWRHTETHGDTQRHVETHRDTETLHTKSVHISKLIFMML